MEKTRRNMALFVARHQRTSTQAHDKPTHVPPLTRVPLLCASPLTHLLDRPTMDLSAALTKCCPLANCCPPPPADQDDDEATALATRSRASTLADSSDAFEGDELSS